MSTDSAPPMAEFIAKAEAFLSSNAKRRRGQGHGFAWGRGSDSVALFEETSPAQLDAAREWRRTTFDAGFGWLMGPVVYGGRGLSRLYERAYARLEAQYIVPSKQPFAVSLGMVAPATLDFGGEALKREVLRPLWRGDLIGCQLFSEPGAGSDLAGLSTSAQRSKEGWLINGQKVWTSGAHYADVGLLLARSSPGPRHRNLTAFLIDMEAPGVAVRPLRQMTGATEFNEVFLTDVIVPDDRRLGDVDAGWAVAVKTLLHERGSVAGATSGGTGILHPDRLLSMVLAMGLDRDPVVCDSLARVYSGLLASRALRLRVAADVAAGRSQFRPASVMKLSLTNDMSALSEFVTTILGPRLMADTGEWGTFAWGEFVLSVPGYRMGGGTDEIQKNIIAERVLGLPKDGTRE